MVQVGVLNMEVIVKKPTMSWDSLTRLLTHTACCLAVFGSGLYCIYPVVAAYIRSHYNLTQPEAGIIAITSQVGESLHLPSALTLDAFGPKWTMVVGLIISGSGWFWAWWTSRLPVYNQPGFVVLAVMFFITAFGRTYTYCSGFVTMIHNAPEKHRGKVTAFLDALFELAVLVMFLVYRWIVLSGNEEASAEENSRFFLYIGTIIVSFIVITFPFMKMFKKDKDSGANDDSESNGTIDGPGLTSDARPLLENRDKINTEYYQEKNNNSSALRLIFSLEYQLFLWGSALSIALTHFMLFNIASFTLTLSITYAEKYLLGIFKASILLSRVLCGYLFDRFGKTMRSYYLLISLPVLGTVGLVLVLIPFHQDYILAVTYFLSGFVEGSVYIAVPVFITEVYGLRNLGRNVSLIYTIKMVTTVSLQIVYDSAYQTLAAEDGYCIGYYCVLPAFLGFIALGVFSIVCCSIFSARVFKNCVPKRGETGSS